MGRIGMGLKDDGSETTIVCGEKCTMAISSAARGLRLRFVFSLPEAELKNYSDFVAKMRHHIKNLFRKYMPKNG